MESLSIPLSSSPPFSKNPKTHKITTPKPYFLFPNCNLIPNSIQSLSNFIKKTPKSSITTTLKPNLQSLSFLFVGFPFPLSSFASESASIELPTNQSSSKINLEAIVVSIDDFFNRYPFFVAGVVFIWLFVIPVSQGYLRKYKPISAIDAFKKLKEDPNAQLLDIRDNKTVRVLGSPNLKILNKKAVQVEFSDGDDEGFAKKVKENFGDPANTTICILDNFDGDSMKVAELLFNNGFKEAYAIRGGVRGDNGWQEIQETLLPPSVHVFPKTGVKKSNNNGSVGKQSEAKSEPTFLDSKQTNNGYVDTSTKPNTSVRPSSPYSMYPDMKPPSSPTPSKPQ
ncbi:rhodanese-like domain-containing protein 4A, chloroplastic [Cynara cardunculus var. scolymus]|uniref:rhodanese-like domain-containing protein 4A, chloroplastic n=1 Tax=Cynara cardunculus var. scolymus TaxID=59895 RepID=UPI000D627A96|nr:rhodanese-like domain-containing protein 4A, chloroplastic [Cynara cardunculus var. scolymus]